MGTLAEAFTAVRPDLAGDDALEERLRAFVARARDERPEVKVGDEDFLRHVAERFPEGSALEELAAGDLLLACGCARGEPLALESFGAVLERIRPSVSRIDSSHAFADEALQRARETLLVAKEGPAKIATFRGQGPLEGWVRIATTRLALRLARERKPDKEVDAADLPDRIAPTMGPEMDYLKDRYRPEFEASFRDALAGLPEKPRTLLRLHYVEGWNVDRIGARFGIHRATAARWVAGARQLLLEDVRGRLRTRLGVADSELDSLVRLVASQLEVSLNQLVDETPEGS